MRLKTLVFTLQEIYATTEISMVIVEEFHSEICEI